jgi:DNA/RNA endonuclease G (NUC1)
VYGYAAAVICVLTFSIFVANHSPVLANDFIRKGKAYEKAKVRNSGSIGPDWRSYRVSVDQVEGMTGFDFFSNVPTSIQNVIEANVDNQ